MATDMSRLQGEIAENPVAPKMQESVDATVQSLLAGLLRTLLEEQKPAPAPIPIPSTGNEVPSFLQRRSAGTDSQCKESV
jgi:hypothetical protein